MSELPPFRHLGDRLVHQGYIWSVAVATFESPDGELFERDVIRSPGAVGVVPLLYDGGVPTVVFVRQYRGPLDRYVLEIPAGMRDIPDEPPEVTAERELIEEAGLSAGSLEYLTHFYTSGTKPPFKSFWKDGAPMLAPKPIPPFHPTKWVSRWEGIVV